MILSGSEIKARNIIRPFHKRTVTKYHMTFGLGPAGYDVRIEFDAHGEIPYYNMRPGEFILASTWEAFIMPDDVSGIVHDKSTWARRGIAVQNTVIEPGWNGHLTLELTNHSEDYVKIGYQDPIAQIVFHEILNPSAKYEGKYQNQMRGPQEAK